MLDVCPPCSFLSSRSKKKIADFLTGQCQFEVLRAIHQRPLQRPENSSVLLESCQSSSDSLELRVSYGDIDDPSDQSVTEADVMDTICKIGEAIQARRKVASKELRVGKKEMLFWTDDNLWKFVANFPGSSAVTNTSNQGQSTSQALPIPLEVGAEELGAT